MDELSDILNEFLNLIEQKLNTSKSIFNLWFGNLKLVSLSEQEAVFLAPSPLKKKILVQKYGTVIEQTLEEVIGFSVNIKIESEKDPEKDFPLVPSYIDEIKRTPVKTPEEQERERLEEEKKSEMISDFLKGNNTDKKSLIEQYTFDNFIEGDSNKFAKAACFAVATEPSSNQFNPLFIHGNSGLGKTHLLYAIINHLRKNNPELKIIYKKCEEFLNELIISINTNSTYLFKEKYRSADVLLIDDIQSIARKESMQEEIFNTITILYESEKQIVLTSDRPPKEIKPLTDRLHTRFEMGLIVDVQPPNIELRSAIILKKAKALGLEIPQNLVYYIAERLISNIRQIEGVITKLYAMKTFSGTEITKSVIDEAISVVDPGNIPPDIMVERILSIVSKHYGVSVEDIKSKKKTGTITNARQVAAHIIKSITTLTLDEIGQALGGRNHSTMIYSLEKVDLMMRTVKNKEAEILALIKEVKDIK
ncbi:MAG: chromosomal replication initiator protein DnaA [Clostridia bacterium]|nr:chromosomal replication initiator protein DnaA [Clostridia bacterium]